MMRWLAALLMCFGLTAAAVAQPAPTRVAILGVEHAGQLVARGDSPAHLAAFIRRMKPDAICVERAPEPFARGDQYEFTYEIQHVILPVAAAERIALCPFDWMPSGEDQKLGFGLDLEATPEVRQPEGFQGFLFFPEPATLKRTLFAADAPASLQRYRDFASIPAPQASRDIARRLYLYRTYMQAQRIRAAAKAHPGKTLLVVVGEFHKHDLEAILAGDKTIDLVQPSSFGAPTDAEIAASTTHAQLAAILSFNLLGRQAASGNLDLAWLGEVLAAFERDGGSEARLFRLRHDQLSGKLSGANAAKAYRDLAKAPDQPFTWTGVEQGGRVDSFFDAYGNLTVAQRARIEAAKAMLPGKQREADALVAQVGADLSPRKARQLDACWQREAQSARAKR
ncbi:hypothetical protein ACFOMD_13400 [Sphingoaurantiacus capsulatus]|uniref:Uncharacterized protein n=1 Tax=Sphingoaurantiacus capsulatus TaxID=1771310 RepID=A0ABV7XF40_9SPHN